ncbi:MAG TPA: oxalurate catabolism protein HpxZ [Terracidiphilus sp.]|jgi:hypothetical protein
MTINDPDVIAELRELYSVYEHALVTNDVEILVAMFWTDPHVMRFGVTENLYGYKEIDSFRKSRPAANLAREVKRLDIVSFDKDFASITLEFTRGTQHGRQTQAWVRFPQGWRIVSAHVSLMPA